MKDQPSKNNQREMVRLAYAFLLVREPESEAVVDSHLQAEGGGTLEALRSRIIRSDEFAHLLHRVGGVSSAAAVAAVGPLHGLLGEAPAGHDGCFTDRFGVRTRVSYLPSPYQRYAGQVGSADGSFDMPVHEKEELNALLRSVSEAKDQFAIMEPGAGWGPWIVLGAHLAQRRGIASVLMGVEGSAEHVDFMRTHMIDNGLNPELHHVVQAVVGTYDGVAYFPKLPDPSGDWGAEANYHSDQANDSALQEVPCFSLTTLLHRMPVLDLLHCDVQGAESDVLSAGIETVNRRVRRICIGTHGRLTEAKLFNLMAGQHWELEFEQPCVVTQQGGDVALAADGVQVWRNNRML